MYIHIKCVYIYVCHTNITFGCILLKKIIKHLYYHNGLSQPDIMEVTKLSCLYIILDYFSQSRFIWRIYNSGEISGILEMRF